MQKFILIYSFMHSFFNVLCFGELGSAAKVITSDVYLTLFIGFAAIVIFQFLHTYIICHLYSSDLLISIALATTGAIDDESRVLLRGVNCSGSESSVTECQYDNEYLGVSSEPSDTSCYARVLCGRGIYIIVI